MFLLDTVVVSELRRAKTGRADKNVMAWAKGVSVASQYISVTTLEELEIGVLRAELRDPVQGKVLRDWLDGQVVPSFSERLLPTDVAVARRCAALHVPKNRPANDAKIAATALAHGMSVVTRNVRDFEPMGVRIINPWEV
ncbi:type II toxin-antitoxin system VapC family toxin [Nocardia panacis]|uniref:Type II toxin-antitoxin system VapC family toxin n=1 Tax=Nocardia panacis TaxID=2340916 RepID=A0A3A4KCE7_9NOCA|nr:type II toxin-antitoxin system VapC family toxin [Nocardia panacis]